MCTIPEGHPVKVGTHERAESVVRHTIRPCGRYSKHALLRHCSKPLFVGFCDKHKANVRRSVDLFLLFVVFGSRTLLQYILTLNHRNISNFYGPGFIIFATPSL